MFSEGREDVNDEERAGRPSTSTTDEKINEVEKMILANRRITVREVAEDLNISIGSCHSNFINDLGMRPVAAKFVPKLLNCDQKQHRMNIANEMLDSVRDDLNLLQRVITGDEAWVYGYDVETKAQSSQWKLPHEPIPKKARQVRSNVKVLLTVFFDCRGVVHHEFLPQGRTVNKEYYLQVMRNLREAIRQKRPDLWKNKNWLLHHDNAPAHTSLFVRDFLAKNNTLMMPQPPYSPDLAPCDFFLFPKLKRPMKGRQVHLDEDIQDILEYLYDSGSEIDDEVKDPDYKNSASDELEFEEEEREEIPAKRPRLEVAPVRMLTTCRDTSTAAAGSNVAAGTWRKDDPSPPTPPPFTARPGLNLVGDVSSPFDAFSLFFTENIFKSIKEETNRYARSIIDRESKKGPLKPHGMLAKWKAVSVAQIKLFFCVIIHMSLVKKPGMKDYWSTHGFLKNAFCQSINMPRTLFMRILSMLHLNDNSKYIEYGKPGHDRLFKIRPVLESLIYSFGNAYTPQQNLTIDEAMCPFRGRVGFRVYIKGKPHKYGIKIFQICEAVSGYAYNLDIYTGKDPEQPEHNSIPNLVDRLAKRFYGQGYHIYFDRWFSSPELFDKLWEKKTLAVGTVMPSRKTMPKTEFSQKLKRGEIIKMRRKHLLAIKWKDVRDVFMLSTVHEGKMMPVKPKTPTREELFKPDAVIDYNKGKVGVDRSDQMMAYYSFSRKTLKWWKKIFFHLFSLCFVNGNIIYNKANPDKKISLKDFYLAVGGELLNQASIEHSEKETTSKTDVARLLGKHYCYKIAPESGKAVQRRCKVCADSAKHKTGKAARKDTRFECKQCKIPLCVGECFEKYHTEMKYWE
ncbi:PGBD5 [Cordylochernes scorpioides]|uniref:PGBD5 n=1 Tax=Cordylochernes scorpioides TaxID=51811 RepID=A0ABY6JZT2_9ARAC|nr:PGBD5 [Cordylochernes scorpioides]